MRNRTVRLGSALLFAALPLSSAGALARPRDRSRAGDAGAPSSTGNGRWPTCCRASAIWERGATGRPDASSSRRQRAASVRVRGGVGRDRARARSDRRGIDLYAGLHPPVDPRAVRDDQRPLLPDDVHAEEWQLSDRLGDRRGGREDSGRARDDESTGDRRGRRGREDRTAVAVSPCPPGC